MNAVFADTFYFLALLSEGDEAHARAVDATLSQSGRLVTTVWVLTEVGDALAAPGNRSGFLELLDALGEDPAALIVPASNDLFDRSVALYSARSDKSWSLTDCVSFVVMQDMQIHEALTGDHHFEQAGFTALLA